MKSMALFIFIACLSQIAVATSNSTKYPVIKSYDVTSIKIYTGRGYPEDLSMDPSIEDDNLEHYDYVNSLTSRSEDAAEIYWHIRINYREANGNETFVQIPCEVVGTNIQNCMDARFKIRSHIRADGNFKVTRIVGNGAVYAYDLVGPDFFDDVQNFFSSITE